MLFPAQKAGNVAVGAVVPVVVAYDDQHLTIAQLNAPGTVHAAADAGDRDAAGQLGADAAHRRRSASSITGVSRDNQRILRAIYNPITRKIRPPSLTPIRLLPQVTVKQFPSVLTGDSDDGVAAGRRQRRTCPTSCCCRAPRRRST